MRKKTKIKLMLVKELIDFDIIDFLYINHSLRYAKSIIIRMLDIF